MESCTPTGREGLAALRMDASAGAGVPYCPSPTRRGGGSPRARYSASIRLPGLLVRLLRAIHFPPPNARPCPQAPAGTIMSAAPSPRTRLQRHPSMATTYESDEFDEFDDEAQASRQPSRHASAVSSSWPAGQGNTQWFEVRRLLVSRSNSGGV